MTLILDRIVKVHEDRADVLDMLGMHDMARDTRAHVQEVRDEWHRQQVEDAAMFGRSALNELVVTL